MNNCNSQILPGSRVMVFDPCLFVDDIKTPSTHTIRPATVICRYGERVTYSHNVCYDDFGNQFGEPEEWEYPDLIDVVFDHALGRISHGHFTNGVSEMTHTLNNRRVK